MTCEEFVSHQGKNTTDRDVIFELIDHAKQCPNCKKVMVDYFNSLSKETQTHAVEQGMELIDEKSKELIQKIITLDQETYGGINDPSFLEQMTVRQLEEYLKEMHENL